MWQTRILLVFMVNMRKAVAIVFLQHNIFLVLLPGRNLLYFYIFRRVDNVFENFFPDQEEALENACSSKCQKSTNFVTFFLCTKISDSLYKRHCGKEVIIFRTIYFCSSSRCLRTCERKNDTRESGNELCEHGAKNVNSRNT